MFTENLFTIVRIRGKPKSINLNPSTVSREVICIEAERRGRTAKEALSQAQNWN